MKNFLLIILSITIFSCADNTSKKSEFQVGIVEMNDSKSQAMDNFTEAYLENNLETQIDNAHNEAKENVEDDDSDEIVIEDVEAVASVSYTHLTLPTKA